MRGQVQLVSIEIIIAGQVPRPQESGLYEIGKCIHIRYSATISVCV